MAPVMFGWLGFGALIVILCLRVPIAAGLLAVGLGGLTLLNLAATGDFAAAFGSILALLGRTPYSFVANFALIAIPVFLLMGSLAYCSGATTEAYKSARTWFGHWPGGLAIATIAACALFASISGSSLASAAAMGRIAVPEMLRYRYDKALATGTVAAGGTLGALIPPSILMVIYGIFAEESIGRLLVGGIVPGLLTAASYMFIIWVRVKLNPDLAPKAEIDATWREKVEASKGTFQFAVIFCIMIGSLYSGLATATEAAALGATGVLLLGLIRGKLNRANFKEALLESARQTATIFAIAVGAKIFVSFIAFTGLAPAMAAWVQSIGTSPVVIMIGLTLIYLLLGMFLDPLGIMLLTLPIALPIIKEIGYDTVWFGVLLVKYLEIGCITPPVGLNVFVLKGAVGDAVKIETIFRGIFWFFVMDIVTVTLMIAVPETVTWLPDLMFGPR